MRGRGVISVAVVLLADWWARLDPTGAFEWIQRERMGMTPAVTTAVVRAWAGRDPEEAARAIEGIANRELHRTSVDALVRGWNDSGRPGLTAYLVALPRGIERQRAISLVARSKVHREGVEETFRWAEALPDDPDGFKLNVFRRVASWAAEVDPQRAAAWAERHGQGEYGKGLYRRVGTRWARQDGLAAMTWLATLPAGPRRDVGVEDLPELVGHPRKDLEPVPTPLTSGKTHDGCLLKIPGALTLETLRG